MRPIAHSNQAVLVSSSGQHFIIDTVLLKMPSDENEEVRDVRNLARTLREADPQIFGLLQCQGVAKRFAANGKLKHFDFAFRIPIGLQDEPANLRSLLLVLADGASPTLDDRFLLAKSMARSVAYVHTCNFVHKSIRPDTVIVFPDSNSFIGPSFLVGFEKFRPVSGRTHLAGDMLWEKNLYRHPRRQGIKPEEEYTMQHDIYSLGVCLLEIGLWSSFVVPDSGGARVGDELDISDFLSIKDQTRKARQIKDYMTKTATQRLPSLMGKRYTEVVLQCLTCLDVDNRFGNESDFEDEDGIKVGVRYIEKVGLAFIRGISIEDINFTTDSCYRSWENWKRYLSSRLRRALQGLAWCCCPVGAKSVLTTGCHNATSGDRSAGRQVGWATVS